jgi:hypothetical protein
VIKFSIISSSLILNLLHLTIRFHCRKFLLPAVKSGVENSVSGIRVDQFLVLVIVFAGSEKSEKQ